MMKDTIIIFKKELKNILKDKRTLISTLVIPLFLLPAVFIGIDLMDKRQTREAVETIYELNVVNNDDQRFLQVLDAMLDFTIVNEPSPDTLVAEFPESYQPGEPGNVNVYYSSTSQKSQYARSVIASAVEMYQKVLANERLSQYGLDLDSLYPLTISSIDTAPEQAQSAGFLAMMVPYMILIYVFAGSMGVGMDTTAGEKERGSLAIILVNQVSRSSLALGKIFYVVTVSSFSSLATFLGLIIAFLISGNVFGVSQSMSAISPISIIVLLCTLLITSTLASSIIVFLGSLAKTVKEATSYVMPIYILVVLVGVLTMSMDSSTTVRLFFIPFVNSIFMMKGAIIGEFFWAQVLVMVAVNLLTIFFLLFGVTKLYNSERILYTV